MDSCLYSFCRFLIYNIISSPVKASNEPVTKDESSHLVSNTGGYIVCVSDEKNFIEPNFVLEFSSDLDFLIINPLLVRVPFNHSLTYSVTGISKFSVAFVKLCV